MQSTAFGRSEAFIRAFRFQQLPSTRKDRSSSFDDRSVEQLEAFHCFYRQPFAVWRKAYLAHGIGQLLNRKEFLLRANVPEAQRAVIADGREGFSLRSKRHPTDSLSVSFAYSD